MTLRLKILFGYGMAFLLTGIVLVWAVHNLVDLGQASEAILRENYKSIQAAGQMMNAVEEQDSAVLQVLLGDGLAGRARFRQNEARFLEWLGRAKDNITVTGEAGIIDELDRRYAAYRSAATDILVMLELSRVGTGADYQNRLAPLSRAVRQQSERLRRLNEQTMFGASRQAQQLARQAVWSTSGIGLMAMATGLIVSVLLSKSLVRPLHRLAEAAQRVGQGHYDVALPIDSRDELGLLTGEFNAMARRLRDYHDMNVEEIMAEKKRGEAILRSIEDGILVIDPDLRVTHINLTALSLLAVTSEHAIGRHFLEVINDEGLLALLRQTAETREAPHLDEDRKILTLDRGGETRHCTFAVTPVRGSGSALLCVVLLLRDVTRFRELDRLKSQFVMTASHELRTPLTSISMSIGLLRERAIERLDDSQRQLLDLAYQESNRLRALVNDLLDLEKIESGRIEMQFEKVPVSRLAERVLTIFRPQTEKAHVTLAASLPEEPVFVRADGSKISWVLTNLISNALRYVSPGGQIDIRAERAGEFVHVSVRDDGRGIPREFQDRIFDKFVQVGGSRDDRGSGLGLAICREIIRAHKGTIWVDSEPGCGSTFTFTLPVME